MFALAANSLEAEERPDVAMATRLDLGESE